MDDAIGPLQGSKRPPSSVQRRYGRLPIRQGVLWKGQPVRPRFQRAGRPQEQVGIAMIRRLRRAGPKLPGQLQQGVQITKSCMFHARVTAGARFRLAP